MNVVTSLTCPSCSGTLDLSGGELANTRNVFTLPREGKKFLTTKCAFCNTSLLVSLDSAIVSLKPAVAIEKNTTIGELAVGGTKPVYRRQSGKLYIKLNEAFHVRTKLGPDKNSWLGEGMAEMLDPRETVEVIQFSDGT